MNAFMKKFQPEFLPALRHDVFYPSVEKHPLYWKTRSSEIIAMPYAVPLPNRISILGHPVLLCLVLLFSMGRLPLFAGCDTSDIYFFGGIKHPCGSNPASV